MIGLGDLGGSARGVGDIVAFLGVGGWDEFSAAMGKAEQRGKMVERSLKVSMAAGAAAFGIVSHAAIEFESSFTGVSKTVDGLKDEFGQLTLEGQMMASGFRELSIDIPIDVNELMAIGEAAGQLGVRKDDILGFTETIALLNETTNLTSEAAASELARFDNITKSVADQALTMAERTERVGSTIVALGNSFATTEAEVVAFSQRLASAGTQVDMSQADILAYSAALSSVGVNAEAGGTAFSKMFSMMKTASMNGGEELKAFADVAGQSVEEFRKHFEEDAAGAIQTFLTGIDNISKSGGNVYQVLNDLEMKDVRMVDAVLRLSGAHDLLSDSLSLANSAYAENAALAAEAEQRFMTVQSQMGLFGNIVKDVFVDMGNEVLPILADLLHALNENPEAVQAVVKSFMQLTMISGVAAGAVKAIQGFSKATKAAQAAWKAFSSISGGPIILAITAIVGAAMVMKNVIEANEKSRLKEIDAISDQIESLDSLEQKYNAAIENGHKNAESLENIGQVSEELKAKYEELGISLEDVGKDFGRFAEIEKQRQIEKITAELEIQKGAFERTQGAIDGASNGLERFTAKLFNGNSAKVAQERIEALNQELADLTGNFDENAELQKAFADAGIMTTKALQDEIEKTKKAIKLAQGDAVATKQLTDKLERLERQLEGATDALDNNSGAVESAIDIQTALSELGIRTTAQIEREIKKRKDLLPFIQKNSIEYKALKEQIDELETSLTDVQVATEYMAFDGLSDNLEIAVRDIDNTKHSVKNLKVEFIELDGQIDISAEMQEKIGRELSAMYDRWGSYAGMVSSVIEKYEIFGDKSDAVAGGIGLVETALGQMASGGIDPVSLGFSAVNWALDTFVKKREPINRTIEEVNALLGQTSERFNDLDDYFSRADFGDEMISNFQTGYDNLLEMMKTATGQTLEFLKAQAAEWVGDMEDIFGAYTLTEELDGLHSEFESFVESTRYSMEALGDSFNPSGSVELLENYIGDILLAMRELDPDSKAFKQLAADLSDAYTLMSDLGIDMDGLEAFRDELDAEYSSLYQQRMEIGQQMNLLPEYSDEYKALAEKLGLVNSEMRSNREQRKAVIDLIEAGTVALDEQNQAIDDQIDNLEDARYAWDDYFMHMREEWNRWEEEANYWSGVIDDLLYWDVELDTTDADEALYDYLQDWAEYLLTLDPSSQAYIDGMRHFQELRQSWMNLINPVEDAIYANENANDVMEDGGLIANEYSDALDGIADSAADVGTVLAELANIQSEIFDPGSGWNGDDDDLVDWDKALEQLLDDLAILSNYEPPGKSKWSDNILAEISYLTQAMGMLDPATDAYTETLLRLMDAYRAAGIPQDMWVYGLSAEEEALARVKLAGYETEDMIWEQIGMLEGLIAPLDSGSYEYQQIAADLGTLYDKLGLVNPWLEEQTGLIETLSISWGDGLDYMFGQYDAYMNAFSYREGANGLEFTGDAFAALERMKKFGLELAGSDIESQLQMWVQQMQAFMEQLDPNSDAYKEAETGLNAFIEQFLAMGGSLEDMPPLDPDVDPGNSMQDFYNQIEALSTDIDNMLDYEVNLDTSDADERIAGMIDQLKIFLGTMDPSDPGYQDASSSLDALIAQFTNMYNILNNLYGIPPGGGQPPTLHSGGFWDNVPVAHSGELFDWETFAKIRKDELVLQPAATAKWGKQVLQDFNERLDPRVLLDGSQGMMGAQQANTRVVIKNANPLTFAEMTDQFISPRLNRNDQFKSKNPFV